LADLIADGLPTWSPISYRSSVGQGKFAGKRPLYHSATQQRRSRHMLYGADICETVMIHGDASNVVLSEWSSPKGSQWVTISTDH